MSHMFHLGWFMGSGFSVQTWALDPWAGNTGHDWMKGDLFVDLAASLERARFDYLLVEDTSMVEDAYGRSMETTLKYGLLGCFEPPILGSSIFPLADTPPSTTCTPSRSIVM